MAPPGTSVRAALGALLAVAAFAAPAPASPDREGATSAAPISCVAEQFALRSYVISRQSAAVTSGDRDPARIVEALTPVCGQAIQGGRWPGLAHELLAHASEDPAVKRVICELAPPEAWSAVVTWESADEETRAAYDLPCAVALFRHRPEDFTRVVVPRLGGAGGCSFPDLAARLGAAVAPAERLQLLPTLEFATRTHAQGRDRLFAVLCEHPAARTQAVCQAPAVLEKTWAHEARIERARTPMALHLGLAALFALAACLLRHYRGTDWPAVTMSVIATVAATAMVTWAITTAPTPGAGPPNARHLVMGVVATPVAALFGALVAWAFIRSARGAALPWCLLHAALYGAVGAFHAWNGAWDRLC